MISSIWPTVVSNFISESLHLKRQQQPDSNNTHNLKSLLKEWGKLSPKWHWQNQINQDAEKCCCCNIVSNIYHKFSFQSSKFYTHKWQCSTWTEYAYSFKLTPVVDPREGHTWHKHPLFEPDWGNLNAPQDLYLAGEEKDTCTNFRKLFQVTLRNNVS